MSGITFQDNLHIIVKRGDNYINFQSARQDLGSTTNKYYYAWLAADGSYIIMEDNHTDPNDTTTKYFHSKDSTNSAVFQTDWDDRVSLTYKEYNEIFS